MRKILLPLVVFSAVAAAVVVLRPSGPVPSCSKVIFIGLDGVPWGILQRLIDDGRMPVMGNLASTGIRAYLRTQGAGSPAKWTTMATGVVPERHGINGFQVFEDGQKVEHKSYHRQAKALWLWASAAGRSVGVVNYLVGWPPEQVNGYVVTLKQQDPAYPADIDLDVENEPLDRFLPPAHCDGARREEMHRLLNLLSRSFSLGAALRQRHPTDLFIAYTHTTDAMGHRFWKFLEPKRFRDDFWNVLPQDIDCFRESIPRFLEATDEMIGRILDGRDPASVVIVASDHGMRPMRTTEAHRIFMYDKLYSTLGWQARRSNGELDLGQPSLVSVDQSAPDRWEWARLLVPAGTPEDRRWTRLSDMAHLLRGLRVEPGGDPLFKSVELRQDAAANFRAPTQWDLVITERRRHEREADRLSVMINGKGHSLREFVHGTDISGQHLKEGIFVATGPCIRNTRLMLELKGVDITPTILHILGISIPPDLDGQVMEDIFERRWFARHPVSVESSEGRSSVTQAAPKRQRLNKAEEDAATERLRALGYVQ